MNSSIGSISTADRLKRKTSQLSRRSHRSCRSLIEHDEKLVAQRCLQIEERMVRPAGEGWGW